MRNHGSRRGVQSERLVRSEEKKWGLGLFLSVLYLFWFVLQAELIKTCDPQGEPQLGGPWDSPTNACKVIILLKICKSLFYSGT